MLGLLGLHMLALGSISGIGIESPLGSGLHIEGVKTKRKPMKLGNYKHIGDIPKGCKLFNEEIIAEKDGISMTIQVDIVCGTEKARLKKYIKYSNEIYVYVAQTPLQEIIDSGRFFVSNNTLENNTLL